MVEKTNKDELIDDFKEIIIEPAIVQKIEFVPLKKVCLDLILFPKDGSEKFDVKCNDIDLQFKNIAGIKINLSYSAKIQIREHNAFLDSDFLESVLTAQSTYACKFNKERLIHFSLICNEGKIDIIAESFHGGCG